MTLSEVPGLLVGPVVLALLGLVINADVNGPCRSFSALGAEASVLAR